ncbi:hypothetical protein D9756_010418 [Leucocoprinus leucothites]|uniref:Cytochrome P450 n=1 Tax=Leucocoprinus leucothites TaxID=201217 RepID=A0A8H5CRN3_9AGAR|nr:hypothetical protein D9756_010418 [Leucoagaricus leucothites]
MALLRLQDVAFLSICLIIHLSYRHRRRTTLPLPPGPRRWPIIGHALSIPMTFMPKAYKVMGERLGTKIIYLEAFGQSMVVLNDVQMARDLLEKRSALYSSRPHLNMLMDVMDINYMFSVMPYGEEWRNYRRLFQQYFSPKTLHRDQEKMMDFVRKGLLPNMYQLPQDSLQHIKDCIGGFATAITYGFPIKKRHDPTVEHAERAFSALAEAGTPGRFLVDIMPILKYVPEWVPGAGFKKLAREWRSILLQLRDEPYWKTMGAINDGTAPISFVSESLSVNREKLDLELQEERIKQTAAQLYGAASETTSTAAITFILAMLKYPRVQKLAQQEIDSVIGRHRLPEFSDQPDLPYLSAVLKEVLRWNPTVPLGVPHRTTEEDVYEGCLIPKGSIVIANTLAMLHDEEIYQNPSEFIPERFLKDGKINPDIPDPEDSSSTIRSCPGAHIALSKLYIIAVSILSLFDISPELDENGLPIELIPEFKGNAITSVPLPFPCKITPRQGVDVEKLLKEYMNFEMI